MTALTVTHNTAV